MVLLVLRMRTLVRVGLLVMRKSSLLNTMPRVVQHLNAV